MTRADFTDLSERFAYRVKPLVSSLYADLGIDVDALCQRIFTVIQPHFSHSASDSMERWSQNDVLLITYGDSLKRSDRERPLQTLQQ
ncbi:MAG: hypothetical protein AAF978_04975, partial [Cyanobacteria bacterium P01_E01_bin.48]